MIEELNTASNILRAALERYIGICSTIQAICCAQGNQPNRTLQELSDRVADELLVAGSYQAKLRQAQTSMSLSRNSFASIVPINRVPSEILARIFNLVIAMQSCTSNGQTMQFPKYPDLLSHVCSRWREIAIGSRALWSHIDLAPCHSLHQGLLARAAVYADRAEHLPLYLHVMSLQCEFNYYAQIRDTLEGFLASVATRIRYLELVAAKDTEEGYISDIQILESCLGKCVPGTLIQLAITQLADYFLFLKSDDSVSPLADDGLSMPLDLPHQLLEDVWGPITSLRLYGLYPYWTSQAYQGLTELHLTSHRAPGISISELQLVNILTQCPMLRIFQFDLVVTNPLPSSNSITPVQLNELEVLSLSAVGHDQLGVILRWIAPGPVPLQLSIIDSSDVCSLLLNTELVNFLGRSNITKLHLADIFDSYSAIVELLGLLPYLRVLVLERCGWAHLNDSRVFESPVGEGNTLVTRFRLDHLYMLSCENMVDGLLWFVEQNPTRILRFWRCEFSRESQTWDDLQMIQNELYDFCPVVEFITGDKPSPMYSC